ncbi:hypothetical protein D3Y57_19025 [Sphingomonas paeninsulae]|uniref:Uncharacterized protein n=1 Tax=Sphingomonas paeninsulae TaxID=2319844 RepID=A0A494TED7_SPHPE|nr:hypothetical protein [Sphingomonas paeninsulae]AYJ87630.1 hypothetical protein D3Y57_19025 [Sphingomonas paeninsulae]
MFEWLTQRPAITAPLIKAKDVVDEINHWIGQSNAWKERSFSAQSKLDAIIALETPNMASIGRRMAKIARGDV